MEESGGEGKEGSGRWGGKGWEPAPIGIFKSRRLCRTPIVKVIVENVVTCFLGTQCRIMLSHVKSILYFVD